MLLVPALVDVAIMLLLPFSTFMGIAMSSGSDLVAIPKLHRYDIRNIVSLRKSTALSSMHDLKSHLRGGRNRPFS
jgi:hypothetical protein